MDSPAVLALKAKLDLPIYRDGSDWARWMTGRVRQQIRAQRLKEGREKGVHTPEQWTAIKQEFDQRCVMCGCYPVGAPCKDHIVPLYQGGSDGADNLQPLCRECNASKGPDSTNWAEYRREHGFDDQEADDGG